MKNENILLTIVLIILAIFLLGGIFPGMMGYSGMMPFYYPIYSSMWLFGWLFMILVIIALVLFILWLIKQLQNKKW